jgi:hypothetical protein
MGVRPVLSRIRKLPRRAGPLAVWAGLFVVLGLILIPVMFSSVQWSGTAIKGVDRGGIVYYTYLGQNYSIDDTSSLNTHTVYLDPKHPDTSAELGNPYARALDVAVVAVPFVIAAVLVGFSLRQRARRRSEREHPKDGGFGQGLDPEFVRRLNAERRAQEPGAR